MITENKQQVIVKPSPEIDNAIKAFKEDMYKLYDKLASMDTPFKDSDGNKIRDTRPDGYEYIKAVYMENMMHKHFPGWSFEEASPMEINPIWITAKVHLKIIDWGLYSRGIPIEFCVRTFYGSDSARVQYRNCPCINRDNLKEANGSKKPKGKPWYNCNVCHGKPLPFTPENIIDLGNQAGSAVTKALKRSIQKATGIGNDVYKKRLDVEEIEIVIEEVRTDIATTE